MDLKEKCFDAVTDLFEKYGEDKYILQRIFTRVVNYLPNEIENDLKKHETNVTRNLFLTNEQQLFIQIFLSKYQYYYLPTNSCFYNYNSKQYTIVKEDDIIYKLLSTISKDRVLLDWKHKTKKNVISLIKERNLLRSIPETYTIQKVLNSLYPYFFPNKHCAKYFLTIIGDNILKKHNQIIYLVTQNTKKLFIELDSIAYLSIGITNVTSNFMTKCHENHTFSNYRLLKINNTFCVDMWKEMLKTIGLDLLCVAAHYSNRYESSDLFIETKADEELKMYTYYLKNTTQQDIVNTFSSNFLQPINTNANDNNVIIGWKNLHFIWKQFLSNNNLPNMIYSNTLKNILKEKYAYDNDNDSFINITSKYLPMESDFIKFWEKAVLTQHSQLDETFHNELEIDEICSLFKIWVKNCGEEELLSNGTISEENVVKILKHFFPDTEIIEDKYVLNVTCILWNKNGDIEKSFPFIKNKIKESESCSLPLITIEEVYNLYCKYNNSTNMNNKCVVSKRYFEKYVNVKIPKFIVDEKLIQTDWVIN